MKIALVGTSNSILKTGFQWPFNNNSEVCFLNASLGSSCSANAAWAVDQKNIEDFDFLILDLTNNDEHQNTHGINTPERVVNNICTIIDYCAKNKIVPMVIGFPRVNYVYSERPVHNAVMNLCRSFGVTTFDIYSLIENTLASSGYDIEFNSFFQDDAHIKPSIARIVALETLKVIDDIYKSGDVFVGEIKFCYKKTFYKNLSCIYGADVVERSTKLTTQNVAVLRPGCIYKFDLLNEASDLVALHFNAPCSNSTIYFNGERVMGPSPESLKSDVSALLSVIRPVRNPTELINEIEIECRDETKSISDIRFELAGIILQKKRVEDYVSVARRPLSGFEISNSVSIHFMRQLSMLAVN